MGSAVHSSSEILCRAFLTKRTSEHDSCHLCTRLLKMTLAEIGGLSEMLAYLRQERSVISKSERCAGGELASW